VSADAAPDLILPTYESAPPMHSSFGQDAVDLAASAGLVLDPWQAYALERILGETETGAPSAFEATIIVGRQNGKGSVLEALSLAWLFLTDAPLILHSAHEFKTAVEAFRRLRTLILNAPHLERRVVAVTTAAGNEGIELASGQRIKYVARSKGSGRGFTAGKIILDEAYALAADEMAALLPTLATQPEAQIVYTSSAGMASSEHLRTLRDRGRAGADPTLCYLEWCSPTTSCAMSSCRHEPGTDGCYMDDVENWRRSNPAIGLRITEKYVLGERRALPPEEFSRERLGSWSEPDDPKAAPIPLAAWLARVDEASTIAGRRVLSVDVAPDRRSAAIGGAGLRADGATHAALVDHRQGTSWTVARLVDLVGRGDIAGIVLDGASPAAAMLPDLEAEGLTVRSKANPDGLLVVMGAADMAAACGGLQDAVAGDSPDVWHRGDPILTAALTGARRRDIGDGGWGWDRKRTDVDICPLVAVTEAVWGLSVLPIEPEYDLSLSFA